MKPSKWRKMGEIYYELFVNSDNMELFKEFVFELGFEAVEIVNERQFIVRDEQNLANLAEILQIYRDKICAEFEQEIALNLELKTQKNEDWIKNYKSSVRPIEVGKFYIRPSWEAPKNGLIDIIIDPALAFGSGHHESTNLCLQMISKYAQSGLNALDVGCGSGILSIAMAKSSMQVSACDTDEQAVAATLENAKKNSVSLKNCTKGSIHGQNEFDFVVANIIADVILILAQDLKKSLKTGGILILSGILEQYYDRIANSFSDLNLLEIGQKNEWLTFVFKKGNDGTKPAE